MTGTGVEVAVETYDDGFVDAEAVISVLGYEFVVVSFSDGSEMKVYRRRYERVDDTRAESSVDTPSDGGREVDQ